MWLVEKIEINGGFLPGLSVKIPLGLTCIIGARGSGKSTLAEAVRFALCGITAAPKQCADLIQANLAGGVLVTITALAEGSNRYTIKRSLKQNPVLLTSDGRAINTVDLDRGTFLPLDAYSSLEIEAIADEVLGDKRRNLLDELRSEQMRAIHLSLAESTRALETNADRIRTAQRTIGDLTEQIEELADVRARLSALAPSDRESSADFVRLSRQQHLQADILFDCQMAKQVSGLEEDAEIGGANAGTLGFLITTLFIAAMYTAFIFSFTELTTSIPRAGGPFAGRLRHPQGHSNSRTRDGARGKIHRARRGAKHSRTGVPLRLRSLRRQRFSRQSFAASQAAPTTINASAIETTLACVSRENSAGLRPLRAN